MKRAQVWTALALVGMAAPVSLAAAFESRGTIDEVTVYRGQALVTRVVEVDGAAGVTEIVVTDLPERIIPESLFAEADAGLEVRSVRFRARPVMEDVNEEVRALDERIAGLEQKLAASRRHGEVLAEHKGYLAKLEAFAAPAANVELTRGVLNAETLAGVTQLLLTQRRQVAEEELKLAAEQRDLARQIEQAQRERGVVTSGSARTVREAVVLAEVKDEEGGPARLRVRYLVDGASWSPSYTARAGGEAERVRLEYYASIQQMTGEEWGQVAMTLSTATPSLAARAPELAPLVVSLVGPAQHQERAVGYRDAKAENMRQRRAVEAQRGQALAADAAGPGQLDRHLNEIAGADLMLDLVAGERITRGGGAGRGGAGEGEPDGLSVTYALGGRTGLPSRAERQQVQIAALSLPAEFSKVATPALTSSVYDEALTRNAAGMVLLAGPVSAYVDGRFVGSGAVPTVAAGESFVLGFGLDPSLKAGRELVERAETVQGGNRIVEITYRLTVENFGAGAARVRLLDRIPRTREQEIKLTMVRGSPAGDEGSGPTKDGIVRWDVAAAGQAFGAEAAAVEYTIRLEHDKQMSIAGMGAGR